MKKLLEFGFKQVGNCRLDTSLTSGVRFVINDFSNERVIYAYITENQVKYIGICDNTKTTLKTRMNSYQAMQGSGTNERITKLIKGYLKEGKAVNILAWKPETDFILKGMKIDLIKGLENPLIQELKPKWNIKS